MGFCMNKKSLLFAALFLNISGQALGNSTLIQEKEFEAIQATAQSLMSSQEAMKNCAKKSALFGLKGSALVTGVCNGIVGVVMSADKLEPLVDAVGNIGNLSKETIRGSLTVGKIGRFFGEHFFLFAGINFVYRMTKHHLFARKLQSVLSASTDLSLKQLELEQVMMIVAAHDKNLLVMQYLAPRVEAFLGQIGVWKVLANLFVKEDATEDAVNALKKAVAA